jgi:hypothetical protein
MKRSSILATILLGAVLIVAAFQHAMQAAEEGSKATYEYLTIRWGGRENTHIIRPGGKVEFVGPELRRVEFPKGANDRSFFMNVVMNGLTKEGYEFAGMTNDEIVMKRGLTK